MSELGPSARRGVGLHAEDSACGLWQLQAALSDGPEPEQMARLPLSPPALPSPLPHGGEELPLADAQGSLGEVGTGNTTYASDHSSDTVQLLSVYDTPSTLFLVMRAELGGDLATRLASLPGGVCPELEARAHAAALLRGLKSTHAQGIVHRDIKAANVLLSHEGVGRLGDFGVAVSMPEGGGLLTAVCGTQDNMAPEMVLCGHGEAAGYDMGVDMWQMGLLVFEMLFGRHPFRRETEIETLAAILRGDFAMPVTAAVSQQARDLVRGLLMIDPLYRLSASDCLRHQWFSPQLAGGAHRVGRGVFPRVTLRVRAQGEAAE